MEWWEGLDLGGSALSSTHEAVPAVGSEWSLAPRGPSIVIADDEAEVREGLARLFQQDGCVVTALAEGSAPVRHLVRSAEEDLLPAVIGVDHLMPVFSGLQIREALHEVERPMPVLLESAFGREVQVTGESFGAEVVEKPYPPGPLKEIVYGAIADTCALTFEETSARGGAR